jgi:hypothetical protein
MKANTNLGEQHGAIRAEPDVVDGALGPHREEPLLPLLEYRVTEPAEPPHVAARRVNEVEHVQETFVETLDRGPCRGGGVLRVGEPLLDTFALSGVDRFLW